MKRSLTVGIPLAGMAFGLFLFAFMAMVDFAIILSGYFPTIMENPTVSFLFNLVTRRYYTDHPWSGMGPTGFIGFSLAVVSFMVLRRKKGVKTAVTEGLFLFAAPILTAFELGIWHFDASEMSLHVTNFATWAITLNIDEFWGVNTVVYLLSNTTVLLVSSCLFLLGLNWSFHRMASQSVERRYLSGLLLLASVVTFFMLVVALRPSLIVSKIYVVYPHSFRPAAGNHWSSAV